MMRAGLLALLGCAAAASARSANASRPNLIVFYADDLGYGDLGCYGHPLSDTPNVDKLSTEGMKFSNIYTSSPVCSPSRAGLLTGRYQTRSGIYPGVFFEQSVNGLPANETTLAALLLKNGYQTGMVGKWHLGVGDKWQYLPTQHGFESWLGIPYSHDMPDPADCFYDPDGSPGKGCFPATSPEPMHTTCEMGDVDRLKAPASGSGVVQIPLFNGTTESMRIVQQPANLTILDDVYTDAAVSYVKKASADPLGRPFFLYYAFQHTHHPNYAGKAFFNTTERGMFGDSIKALDWSLGEVLAAVKEAGIEDDTIVFFSSDNGPSLVRLQRGGSAGLLRCGKGTTWEGGQRVPGIIKWPGKIKAGTLTREIASTMDLFPTVLAIVGITPPQDRVYDGVDMSSYIFNDNGKAVAGHARDYYFYLYKNIVGPSGLYAIRYREWKAHFHIQGSHCPDDYFVPTCRGNFSEVLTKPMLFNLNHDAGEHVPLDVEAPLYAPIMEIIYRLRTTFLESKGLFGKSLTRETNPMSQPCSQPDCTNPATLGECCRI